MRGNSTRGKNMNGVMGNQGFGDIKVIRDNIAIVIPNHYLFKDGTIKKYAGKIIDKLFEEELKAINHIA